MSQTTSRATIVLRLPEAFGTNTLFGLFYDLGHPPGAIQQPKEAMRDVFELPIFFDAGPRSPKEMAFIVEETMKLIAWVEKHFDMKPNITFV